LSAPKLSVVIPVYNEEATVPELWRRLRETLAAVGVDFEVIFVDDGSSDATASSLEALCREDPRVKALSLSRNFGHACAVTAGIDHARGDAVVLMDGDLQDQPEAIPALLEAWRQGHQVVYAIRVRRKESAPMRAAFRAFYWVLGRLSHLPLPQNAGNFCLMDRGVVEILRRMPEHNRYLPGLRAYAGFRQTGVPVERQARHSGAPRVGLLGLLRLAFDGVFSFSHAPIRLVTLFGLVVAAAAFFFMCIVLYKKLISHEAILGWASTLTAILFLGGTQLVTLGLLGEYIGRIYEEVKKRPYYIVQRRINLD